MEDLNFAVIVGAGPAGATTARQLLSAGLGPVRLLDWARFPRVKPCGSGLSANAQSLLRQMGLLRRVEAEAYPISAAVIGAPSGRQVLLEGDATGLVLDRERLDQLLVDAAVAAGASFEDGVRVRRVGQGAGNWLEVLAEGERRWRTRWVVLATGASSHLTGQRLPPSRLVTMTGWYRGASFREHTMELYFDRELAPHYGWLFPEAPDRVNLGICLDARRCNGRTSREIFQRFVDRHFVDRLSRAESLRPARGFPIAAAPAPASSSTVPGVLMVGEAAHLANRATGEGISLALQSGALAADAIRRGTRDGMTPAQVAEQYRRAVQRSLGPRLWLSDRLTLAVPMALDLITLAGRSALLRRILARTFAHL